MNLVFTRVLVLHNDNLRVSILGFLTPTRTVTARQTGRQAREQSDRRSQLEMKQASNGNITE